MTLSVSETGDKKNHFLCCNLNRIDPRSTTAQTKHVILALIKSEIDFCTKLHIAGLIEKLETKKLVV